MLRLLHAAVLGLVGAGVVHIGIVFLLPYLSENNVWNRMSEAMDLYEPVRLDRPGVTAASLDNDDPLFNVVACRFDLAEGIVRIRASGAVPFWSASIYDRDGLNIESFSDRTSTDASLDLVVLTPAQMTEVRKEIPEDLQKASFIESDATEGIAVIRAFAPDESWTPSANAFLDGLSCQPVLL